jgi:hypothetical protein
MKNLNLCKLPAYDSIDIVRISSSTANRVCQEMDDWLSPRCVRVDTVTIRPVSAFRARLD